MFLIRRKVDGEYLMVMEIPHLNWSIACQYPPLPLHIKKMMAFFLIVCLVMILALIASCSLVEVLYHPVKELLESSPFSEKNGKPVNEFEVIRKNIENYGAGENGFMRPWRKMILLCRFSPVKNFCFLPMFHRICSSRLSIRMQITVWHWENFVPGR